MPIRKNLSFVQILLLFVCIASFTKLISGLECMTCEDCEANPNSVQSCDAKKPTDIPDSGEMACSYEIGHASKLRKRCIFIKNDPSVGRVIQYSHCYKSLADETKEDCICFTDKCNENKPPNDPKPTEEINSGACIMLPSIVIGIILVFGGAIL